MRDIKSVIDSDMCSGCGLCVDDPANMIFSEKGFLRPSHPIEDNVSLNCCPGLQVIQKNQLNKHSIWGPVSGSYTGYASDAETRQLGSSGGVLTGVMTFLLETGRVDAIVQIGVDDNDPLLNKTKIIESSEQLKRNAGSRYAPSAPLSIIRSLIGSDKTYAIVAKPCDISTLRAVVDMDSQYKEKFPYLLSFMCAGVPSINATDDVLSALNVDKHDVVNFRYRGDGWPGLTKAVDHKGQEFTMTYNESWGTILNQKLQSRCKICADGVGESADFVCADAWHESENGYPSFEEQKGRSLILLRTPVGNRIFEEAVSEGYIEIEGEYPLSQLIGIQPFQAKRKKTVLMRMLALKVFGVQLPRYRGFRLFKLAMTTSPVLLVRTFLGSFRRKWKGSF